MLLTRAEMDYDFAGASFDLSRLEDRQLLGWVFNQFLYGEVTGIQCGHWLYRAPHLNAAQFLAKQASEELSHVRKILRILSLIGEGPAEAHWAIRFLSTGMMGGSWGEHVVLEMALGEGLVLSVFYAMSRTIDDPEIRRILESAIAEEERHVEFGERETQAWLLKHPADRKFLLAQAFVQIWVLSHLKRFVLKKMLSVFPQGKHPVLSQLDGFYDQVLACFELRMARLGLTSQSIQEMTIFTQLKLVSYLAIAISARKVFSIFSGRNRQRLTATYLKDPLLSEEQARVRSGRPLESGASKEQQDGL